MTYRNVCNHSENYGNSHIIIFFFLIFNHSTLKKLLLLYITAQRNLICIYENICLFSYIVKKQLSLNFKIKNIIYNIVFCLLNYETNNFHAIKFDPSNLKLEAIANLYFMFDVF